MVENHPSYEMWNDAIARFFYQPAFAGRPVYLQVDQETLRSIAEREWAMPPQYARSFFCMAVQRRLGNSADPFRPLVRDSYRWLDSLTTAPADLPPFLALLGACVLAASEMAKNEAQGTRGSNYYIPLNNILSLNQVGKPPGFEKLDMLWEVLNAWLDAHHEGRLGTATATTHPHFPHVRYPISQCLLRKTDRDKLPDFFQWAGLEGGEVADPEEIAPLLQQWGDRATCTFSDAGQAQLQTSDASLLLQLAQLVTSELRAWEGEEEGVGAGRQRRATIHLRLERQRRGPGYRYILQLFPRALPRFPEGHYEGELGEVTLERLPHLQWFQPLPVEWVAATLQAGLTLVQNEARLSFKARPILPLVPDPDLGWSSENRVRLGEPCLVLCRLAWQGRVESYLRQYASAGWEVEANPSLPSGWCCFRNVVVTGIAVDQEEDLAPLIPHPHINMSLRGGLLLKRGVWLRAAPPIAYLASPSPRALRVRVDQEEVTRLPTGTGPLDLARLNLASGEHTIQVGTSYKRTFYLVEAGSERADIPQAAPLGYRFEQTTAGSYRPTALGPTALPDLSQVPADGCWVTGAVVIGGNPYQTPVLAAVPVLAGYKRYVVLGKHPGEVYLYRPTDQLPYWWSSSRLPRARFALLVPFEPQWLILEGKKSSKQIRPIPTLPASPEPTPVGTTEQVQEWGHWASKWTPGLKKRVEVRQVWEQYRALARRLGGRHE